MPRLIPLLLLAAASALLLPAQYYRNYPRHSVSAGMGIVMPRAELQNLYSNAFGGGFGYGYRFARNFQFDTGLDIGYNAANVNDFLNTNIGPLRIRDFQYFIPVGGRAILPVGRGGRFQFFGGGGWSYLRYSERLRQPGNFVRVDCPSCVARSGQGWYALVGGDYALDSNGVFRLGVQTRIIDGSTDGPALGNLPGAKTNDRWANTFLTFSINF